jgi:hypothetical protein
VVADRHVVDAGVGRQREEAAQLAGVAVSACGRIPTRAVTAPAPAWGWVIQTVRATASTPPWTSSSADPAGCLRPAAGPVRQATRQ